MKANRAKTSAGLQVGSFCLSGQKIQQRDRVCGPPDPFVVPDSKPVDDLGGRWHRVRYKKGCPHEEVQVLGEGKIGRGIPELSTLLKQKDYHYAHY